MSGITMWISLADSPLCGLARVEVVVVVMKEAAIRPCLPTTSQSSITVPEPSVHPSPILLLFFLQGPLGSKLHQ